MNDDDDETLNIRPRPSHFLPLALIQLCPASLIANLAIYASEAVPIHVVSDPLAAGFAASVAGSNGGSVEGAIVSRRTSCCGEWERRLQSQRLHHRLYDIAAAGRR